MNIQRMNKAELIAEARNQGKSVDDDATREELIMMLNDVKPDKDGYVAPERLSGKKRSVVISATEGPGGSDPVPVGLNGKVWMIPRDVTVDVPVEVCGILDNASIVVIEADGKNSDGTLKWRERTVRRFPVQYVQ